MTRKFWRWARNATPDSFGSDRTLYLDGEISDETWYGDEITPRAFKDELNSGKGNITLWINSPGGDVFAAAQIYNMLMDYPYDVTVKIDALAASAASVIAMAGTRVCMSPVAMLMVHNPATIAIGDSEEMQKAIDMLSEVKESIMNAYELKSGLSRNKISKLMDAETWMNAREYWRYLYNKNHSRIVTPDFVCFLCRVYNCDKEAIGKQILEYYANISRKKDSLHGVKGYKVKFTMAWQEKRSEKSVPRIIKRNRERPFADRQRPA